MSGDDTGVPLMAPDLPRQSEHEAWVMRSFAENGTTCYAETEQVLVSSYDEHRAEAGRYSGACEATMATLDGIRRQVEENRQAAVDKYEDIRSDMLP